MVFVQVCFVPPVLGVYRMWKACDVLLYCAGPTYSSSDCLCAAALCSLLFLRLTPNMLLADTNQLFSVFFFVYFSVLPEGLQRIFPLQFEHIVYADLRVTRRGTLICVETDGKQALCQPVTFTVHGQRLPSPFLLVPSKKKMFWRHTVCAILGLLEMNVALRWVSASWVDVFLSGLSEASVYSNLCSQEATLYFSAIVRLLLLSAQKTF